MSDLDELLAGDIHAGAYGKIESPAAERSKERKAERQSERFQKNLDHVNRDLQRAGRERDDKVGEFMRQTKASPLDKPIPLGGNQDIQKFSERRTDNAPRPEEWHPPIKSDQAADTAATSSQLKVIDVVQNLDGTVTAHVALNAAQDLGTYSE